MRQPVKGTIARGFIPYTKPDTLQIESITDSTKNPLPMTEEVLLKGQKKYLTYCSPCHGDIGNGDQRMRGLLPVMPPALHTERAKNFSDAQLYHIITVGRNNGNMPGYSHQISRDERWAIINYVRVLQRAKNATENDIIISKQEPK